LVDSLINYLKYKKIQLNIINIQILNIDNVIWEIHIHYSNPDAKLVVGKFCSIASGVTIYLGGNHRHDWVTTYPFGHIHQNI
jgi:hypothetical protein